MSTRIIIAMLFPVLLSACTSTGAPPPGEASAAMACEIGERKVCTGITGSRIQLEDSVSCNCRQVDNVQTY